MSTIITRSALVYHGHDPAPDVASIVIDHKGRHVRTWADVMRDRRERQERSLANKRRTLPWRAYRLWVAYFDQDLFGGWQAFIEDFRGRRSFGSHWIDRDRDWLKPSLMRLYPVIAPGERFDAWKPAFAEAYPHGTQDGKPRGRVYLWWNGRDEPRPIEEPDHMGVMKRLYQRDGKGLPTDGPTVLRGPKAPAAKAEMVAAEPVEPKRPAIASPAEMTQCGAKMTQLSMF